MKKINIFLVPLACLSGIILLANLLKWITPPLTSGLFVAITVLAIIPMLQEIYLSARRKRMDLSLPVLVTLLILLYIIEYWIAAIFAWMTLLGRIFKEYILWKVEKSVKEISKSLPDIAYLKGNTLREIPIQQIRKGDILVVKAGGRIPVDGILLSEEASVDESVITGESKPVDKTLNDRLVAGSINQSDYLEMSAADTSSNSTLAQIHKMVEQAQSRNTQLARFTTYYALITSIVALAGTIFIYLFTGELLRALAFWIALVPVIFAIIVPVATTIGISILAKKGIMVKSPEALEDLTRINSIVLDKTGTLTKGAPEISDMVIADNLADKGLFLQLVSSIEKYSEHPLARPIIKKATEQGITIHPAQDIQVLKGKGIAGTCLNRKIAVGNKRLMDELSATIPADVEDITQKKEAEGNSVLYVAIDNLFSGAIYVSDPLRENIKDTMDRLKAMNLKLTMLTGDNKVVASGVANKLGLSRYYAGLLPQDKITYIQQFKSKGEKVIMTGDGINDAPALSEANVGIAMGLRGIDVTLNSARVVLVHDDIQALPYMLSTSKRVMAIIRFNLIIATTIHVTTAILSLIGIIGILGSALMHQVSSAIVILNTLRLFTIKNNIKKDKPKDA